MICICSPLCCLPSRRTFSTVNAVTPSGASTHSTSLLYICLRLIALSSLVFSSPFPSLPPSLLPVSVASYSNPLGFQTSPAQKMDANLMGAFSGILPIFPSNRITDVSAAVTAVLRY